MDGQAAVDGEGLAGDEDGGVGWAEDGRVGDDAATQDAVADGGMTGSAVEVSEVGGVVRHGHSKTPVRLTTNGFFLEAVGGEVVVGWGAVAEVEGLGVGDGDEGGDGGEGVAGTEGATDGFGAA